MQFYVQKRSLSGPMYLMCVIPENTGQLNLNFMWRLLRNTPKMQETLKQKHQGSNCILEGGPYDPLKYIDD